MKQFNVHNVISQKLEPLGALPSLPSLPDFFSFLHIVKYVFLMLQNMLCMLEFVFIQQNCFLFYTHIISCAKVQRNV